MGLASGLVVGSMLGLVAGCGEMGPNDPNGKVETGLEYIDQYGNISSNGSLVWATNPPSQAPDSWGRVTPQGGADITHTSSPAVCAKINTVVGDGSGDLAIFSVDNQSHFRTIELVEAGAAEFSSSWGSYGTKTFASKPTCAMRENESGQNNPNAPGFVLAGRGSATNDHYLYASRGIFGASGSLNPPSPMEAFARVDTVNNAYNVNGFPALATDGVNAVGSNLAMVFMGDDNRTIYAHMRGLPYTAHSWSGRITGPLLPTGTTSVSAPSIDWLPSWAIMFHVVVRAVNGGQSKLYETYLVSDGNGSGHFVDVTGGPNAVWHLLPVTGTISGDPSIAYSPNLDYYDQTLNGEMLFYTNGTQVQQTSGFSTFGSLPILAVQLNNITSVSSSPAGVPDPGLARNSVAALIARHNTQLFFLESSQVDFLVP